MGKQIRDACNERYFPETGAPVIIYYRIHSDSPNIRKVSIMLREIDQP